MIGVNSYDKIKIIISKVYRFNENVEYIKIVNNDSEVVKSSYKSVGLEVTINHEFNNTIIVFSAKLLGSNATELVTCNTLDQIYTAINKVIRMPYNELVEDGVVLRLEVTRDISIANKHEVIESLFNYAKLQTKYKHPKRCFKSKKQVCSFWLKKDNTNSTFIDFLCIYDKKAEVIKGSNKLNREFLDALSSEDRLRYLESIQNMVRFEVKLNSSYLIRKHFNFEKGTKLSLTTILNSDTPIVKNMVVKIFDGLPQNLVNNFQPKNKAQLCDYLALKQNDFNISKTIEFLKASLGNMKVSRIAKNLSEIVASVGIVEHISCLTAYQEVLKEI